jgi:hypothetical protein
LVFRGFWVQVLFLRPAVLMVFHSLLYFLQTTARVLPEMRFQSPRHPFIIHSPLFYLNCTSITK